jgi:AcrR family transcriptional regulator
MSTEIETPILSARARILAVAGALFYREGSRAIGVDRVIAEADVAKATFYRHFPSKDDLIVAWIGAAEDAGMGRLPPADGPNALSDYVQAVIAIARAPLCAGCPYQGAAGEFLAQDHPAHHAARAVKERTLASIVMRARALGLRDPDAVGAEVFLVVEGLWASVRMFGADAPFSAAERALNGIILSAKAAAR